VSSVLPLFLSQPLCTSAVISRLLPHRTFLQLTLVENQTDRKLTCLRSDNEGEYKSDEFAQFCRERGNKREYRAPYSSEQNRVAERMNRTIHERIVSMLHHSELTKGFWVDTLLTAVHIINMSLSRPLGLKIPQELWTTRKPDYGVVKKTVPRRNRRRNRLRRDRQV
jgi:transposase InsO family protein